MIDFDKFQRIKTEKTFVDFFQFFHVNASKIDPGQKVYRQILGQWYKLQIRGCGIWPLHCYEKLMLAYTFLKKVMKCSQVGIEEYRNNQCLVDAITITPL